MTTFRPGKMPLYCAHCGQARIMHMPEDMACVKGAKVIENQMHLSAEEQHAVETFGPLEIDPTGVYSDSREDKAEMWRRAHDRTLLALFRDGKVRVV